MRQPTAGQASVICSALYLAYQASNSVSLARCSTATVALLYLSLSTFTSIYLYIAYYLPLVKNQKIDFSNNHWRTTAPRTVQVATISLVTLYITFSIVLSQSEAFHFLGFLAAGVILAGVVAFAQLF
ncbi:hypothetical protein HDU98_008194 [Podochytrium sp. JEL0797]|nr:hypothetical protein HDU98_008194 [Podochytrium sp. JEL0797]